MRRPALTIHLAQVTRELLRLLKCCEVSTLVMLGLEHHLAEYMRPPSETSTTLQQTGDSMGQTYDLGNCASSPGKYDTPRGTDIHWVPCALSCAFPPDIS